MITIAAELDAYLEHMWMPQLTQKSDPNSLSHQTDDQLRDKELITVKQGTKWLVK